MFHLYDWYHCMWLFHASYLTRDIGGNLLNTHNSYLISTWLLFMENVSKLKQTPNYFEAPDYYQNSDKNK